MMNGYAISALILGLAGSLHCIGMCGPLAAALPGGSRRHSNPLLARVYYNLGRICTYALLGSIAGSLGHAVQHTGFQRSLSILTGVLLISGWLFAKQLVAVPFIRSFYLRIQKITGVFLKESQTEAMLIAGMLNGLLPCGLVYTALAASTIAGTAMHASLYMAIFGLGTVPALYLVSTMGQAVRKKGQRNWRWASPALTLTAALFLILRGMALGIPIISPDTTVNAAGQSACCPHANETP